MAVKTIHNYSVLYTKIPGLGEVKIEIWYETAVTNVLNLMNSQVISGRLVNNNNIHTPTP